MKRSQLSRKTQLRPDPEKVREFLRRGRQGFRRYDPHEGPLTPRQWREAAYWAADGRCLITGDKADDAFDPRFHAHHIVPRRVLRDRKLHAYVWDARNAVFLRVEAHERHEHWSHRIQWIELPADVWGFCQDAQAGTATRWATEYVLTQYPVRREPGRHH